MNHLYRRPAYLNSGDKICITSPAGRVAPEKVLKADKVFQELWIRSRNHVPCFGCILPIAWYRRRTPRRFATRPWTIHTAKLFSCREVDMGFIVSSTGSIFVPSKRFPNGSLDLAISPSYMLIFALSEMAKSAQSHGFGIFYRKSKSGFKSVEFYREIFRNIA